ncbi:MAG TPA: hypothetical protein VMQ93_01825, partial [Novosphingobium sp.]|nr:hypothetical protein [Novosphingobium sp.]
MNVNGARYHMLYGRDDWGACAVMVAGKRRKLSAQWKLAIPPATVPAWNAERGHLSLAHLDADIPATQGERSYLAADRRGAAADANGNLYVVNDARDGIDVISRGSGRTSAFWPAPPPRSRSRPGDFGDAAPRPAFDGLIVGLAVTSENYLVAAFGGGLLRFDLVGGGPPERFAFAPSLGKITPTDLAPGPCGGVWLLDGSAGTLYRLDRNLGFVTAPGSAAVPAT